jgi:1-phosphatidylinositol phosphodiesterase
VQTQDWYGIGTLSAIPEKMSLIKRLCQESGSEDDAFTLNYCNGCSFPFALPPAVAKGFLDDGTKTQEERYALTNMMATQGVNSHLRDYVVDLLHKAPRSSRQGAIDGLKVTWALDFYNEPKGAADLVRLLIEANF